MTLLCYNIVFFNSGFKRTLCGSTWEVYSYNSNLEDTGRLGCCPPGKFMTNNMKDPFVAADTCAACETGLFTEGNNHHLSCRTCPKGYEIDGDVTTKCEVCTFSKVSFLFLCCSVRTLVMLLYM